MANGKNIAINPASAPYFFAMSDDKRMIPMMAQTSIMDPAITMMPNFVSSFIGLLFCEVVIAPHYFQLLDTMPSSTCLRISLMFMLWMIISDILINTELLCEDILLVKRTYALIYDISELFAYDISLVTI